MQYVNLGRTGLKVSRICLGAMTYGSPAKRDWILDEQQGRPFIRLDPAPAGNHGAYRRRQQAISSGAGGRGPGGDAFRRRQRLPGGAVSAASSARSLKTFVRQGLYIRRAHLIAG